MVKTIIGTLTLPIAVIEFSDGSFMYEIGTEGQLASGRNYSSFDYACDVARESSKLIELYVLSEYATAKQLVTTKLGVGE
jgi:hypothetical protein